MVTKNFNNIAKPLRHELIEACKQNDIEKVKEFLSRGADINEIKNGTLVIADTMTALMVVSHCGYQPLAQLLIDNSADIDALDCFGNTALMLAASNGQADIAEMLIKNGAKLDVKNINRASALSQAKKYGHEDVVEKIEQALKDQAAQAVVTEKQQQKIMQQVLNPATQRPLRVKPIVQIK